jgi:type IV pilus assembly protein PilB
MRRFNHINRDDIKILTAENPVEYNLDGIVQVQVNPDLKLGEDKCFDFATALRSFLRLDPDVIMVGEIRDQETAHIAMEAAMTGHLVFSTIHTNDAPSTVTRLVDMGIPAFMVASTLKCVLAQRLCRRFVPTAKPPMRRLWKKWKCLKPIISRCLRARRFFKGPVAGPATAVDLKAGWVFTNCWSSTTRCGRSMLKEMTADSIRDAAVDKSPQKMRSILVDGLQKVLEGQHHRAGSVGRRFGSGRRRRQKSGPLVPHCRRKLNDRSSLMKDVPR